MDHLDAFKVSCYYFSRNILICNKSITGVKRKEPVAITNLPFLKGESYECFSYPRNLHSLPFSTETLACSYLLIVWQDDV